MPKEFLLHVLNPSYEENGLKKEDVENHKHFTIYKLSCFLYTLAGIIRICDNQYIDGTNLIIQSVLSYMSDVKTMGTKSKWHVADRYFALIISLYHFYSIRNSILINKIINVVLFLIGYKFLKKSQNLYKNNDEDFLTEHTKWHIVAPIMSLFK